MNLKNKAISGTLWNFLMIFTVSGTDFFVFTILARNLPINEFALLTFCFLLIEFGNIFVTAGINQNLIQRSVWDDKFFQSVFTFVLVVGLITSVIISGLGSLIAHLFYSALASDLIIFLGLLPIVFGLQSTFSAKLERDFRNKEIMKIKSGSSLLSGVLIVLLINSEYGIWAAVIGKVIQNLLVLLLLYFRSGVNLKLSYDSQHLSEIKQFCLPLFGMAFINFFHSKGANLLVGAVLGAERFAFLSVANRAFDTLARLTISTVNAMVVPTLSRLEASRKVQAFYQILNLTAAFIAPAFIGLAAISEPLILVAFGKNYLESVILIQILCIAIIPSLLGWYLPNLMISVGETSIAFKLKVFCIVRSLGVALAFVWFGVELMLLMQTLATFLLVPFELRLARKVVDLDIKVLLKQVMPASLSSIFMFASVTIVKIMLSSDFSVLAILGISIIVGILSYVFFFLIFFSDSLKSVLSILKSYANDMNSQKIG